jgi:hypothetical protein
VTDRFTQAVEQLGNADPAVGAGGTYALEQIANDSPQDYRWTVTEILTTFVRQHAPLRNAFALRGLDHFSEPRRAFSAFRASLCLSNKLRICFETRSNSCCILSR